MKLNLPNLISIFRVVASPFVVILLLSDDTKLKLYGAILYAIAAFSDFLDGWLARKMNLVSSWGRFFDPLADKFLTVGVFLALVFMGIANGILVAIIIARDIFTTYMRVIADRMNSPIRTSMTAKTKTFIQMLYLSGIIVIIMIDTSRADSPAIMDWLLARNIPDVTLFFITLLTLWSTYEYIRDNKSIFAYFSKKNK